MIRYAFNAGVRNSGKVIRALQQRYEQLNGWTTRVEEERLANA
jgi:hypothetical protein